MDKIFLEGMSFYGYHGCQPEETTLGQKFTVDMELCLDLKTAGDSDDLAATVDYVAVTDIAKDVITGTPYKLIETVAEKIASLTIASFSIVKAVSVTVKKSLGSGNVGVTVERHRS